MIQEKSQKQLAIVNAIVLDDKNRILLVRRDRKWHAEAHDKWEFPGGKIDFGETPEDACVREAKEESGFEVTISRLIPKLISSQWSFSDRESQQLLIAYQCTLTGGSASSQDSGVSDVQWFSKDEVLELDCLPGTKEFLEYVSFDS